MSNENIIKAISDARTILQRYEIYGEAVRQGLKQLDALENLVKNGEYNEAYSLGVKLYSTLSPYRDYVPDLVAKADVIKVLLEQKRESTTGV